MRPLVVKIGGSLVASGAAREVLHLVTAAPRQIVVVPGGGAYADAVRADQIMHGFSNGEAHRRAILAMHRMALDFQVMQTGLLPVETIAATRGAWAAGRIPVWLPWPMVEHDATVPQDWSMTSDGLAAWFAGKLDGADVALVKSCVVPPGATLEDLATAGTTDPQFPVMVARSGLKWHVLGKGDEDRLGAVVAGRTERRAD